MRAILLTLLVSVALGYLTVLTGMYAFQRRQMYFPDRQSALPPEGMREIWLTAADGVRLNAWYQTPAETAGVVLYLHGNGGNLGSIAGRLSTFLDAGQGVLALDWRGYGKSEGAPDEEGLYADGRAALAFLTGQGISLQRVVIYGESLGSGIATKLAAETPVAGLILEAPFLSVAEAAQHHYPYLPARWLVKDRYDNLSRIKSIAAPILILHGEADRTVPVSHGRALLAAAGPKAEGRFFPLGGHMDSFDLGGRQEALGFIERVLMNP